MNIRTVVNGDIASFFIPKPTNLPSELILESSSEADDACAPVISQLLSMKGFDFVVISSAGPDTQIDIKLSGKQWSDIIGRNISLLDRMKQGFDKKFLQDNLPIVSIDDKVHYDVDFTQQVQAVVDNFSEKQHVVKEHGGSITVTGYDPQKKIISLQFSGACATSCGKDHGEGARTITEQMLTHVLCQRFPGAFNRSKMEFTSLG
ncbi:MAG: hypothetical protein AAF549_01425 [Pseudomonadota bacterium]